MKYIISFLILLLTTPTYADITVDMLNKRDDGGKMVYSCLLYTSPSPRDRG